MVDWLCSHLPQLNTLVVGTGESRLRLGLQAVRVSAPLAAGKIFYRPLRPPIVDGGVVLRDMILLRRDNTETACNIEE